MIQTRMTIADITGEAVLYRDLQPCDSNLRGLQELRTELGIASHTTPRKRDGDYARVIRAIVDEVRHQQGALPIQTALVVGDTDNDRWLAEHLRSIGVPTYCFLGTDRHTEPPTLFWNGDTAHSNRWSLLQRWQQEIEERNVNWQHTALILDIDKTLLGPRGRCDAAIDDSRSEGALMIASELLGDTLDPIAFRTDYARLCRSEYHALTLDNQDYVVYLSLLLATNSITNDEIQAIMAHATPTNFRQLLATSEARIVPTLRDLHHDIRTADAAGDPTPFKRFRRAEFAATVTRMRDGRLTLCNEVVSLALLLRSHGTLCIAASDKPAEASLPSPEQLDAGFTALHHTPAYIDTPPG